MASAGIAITGLQVSTLQMPTITGGPACVWTRKILPAACRKCGYGSIVTAMNLTCSSAAPELAGVLLRVDFKIEREAFAFAEAFGGSISR